MLSIRKVIHVAAARELERVGGDDVGARANVIGMDRADGGRLAFHLVAFPGHTAAQHLTANAAIEDDDLAILKTGLQLFVSFAHAFA